MKRPAARLRVMRSLHSANVERFMEKISKLPGWKVPPETGNRLWFFSRNGFDEQASQHLRALKILHCDIHGVNALCRTAKIGEVPV